MAQHRRPREVRRGDIFSVDFDPSRGSEQGKIRPALVIQNDIGNHFGPTIIVAAITTGEQTRFPVQVAVEAPDGGLRGNSLILLNQLLTVDKSRLGEYWGHVSHDVMQKVDNAIAISLGLTPQ